MEATGTKRSLDDDDGGDDGGATGTATASADAPTMADDAAPTAEIDGAGEAVGGGGGDKKRARLDPEIALAPSSPGPESPLEEAPSPPARIEPVYETQMTDRGEDEAERAMLPSSLANVEIHDDGEDDEEEEEGDDGDESDTDGPKPSESTTVVADGAEQESRPSDNGAETDAASGDHATGTGDTANGENRTDSEPRGAKEDETKPSGPQGRRSNRGGKSRSGGKNRRMRDHGPPRVVYYGNLDEGVTPSQVLDTAFFGVIESVRMMPLKRAAFVTYVSPMDAHRFLEYGLRTGINVGSKPVKLGWGRNPIIDPAVQRGVSQGNTRCVFIGTITEAMTEEWFRREFARYGNIDRIRILNDKKMAFIHFTSIASAIDCVTSLNTDETFRTHHKINFGKDPCNRPPPQSHHTFGEMGHRRGLGLIGPPPGAYGPPPGAYGPPAGHIMDNGPPPSLLMREPGPPAGAGSRSVYLGNLDPATTYDELCAVIRGGAIESVKIMPEKACAFASFVDVEGANTFFEYAGENPLVVRGKTLKIGWGKNMPLPQEVVQAINSGATRNVYIGNIDDGLTETKLQADFSEFGTIERTQLVPDRHCAFVEFTSVSAAARAVRSITSKSPYNNYRINYGKDSCARMPKNFVRKPRFSLPPAGPPPQVMPSLLSPAGLQDTRLTPRGYGNDRVLVTPLGTSGGSLLGGPPSQFLGPNAQLFNSPQLSHGGASLVPLSQIPARQDYLQPHHPHPNSGRGGLMYDEPIMHDRRGPGPGPIGPYDDPYYPQRMEPPHPRRGGGGGGGGGGRYRVPDRYDDGPRRPGPDFELSRNRFDRPGLDHDRDRDRDRLHDRMHERGYYNDGGRREDQYRYDDDRASDDYRPPPVSGRGGPVGSGLQQQPLVLSQPLPQPQQTLPVQPPYGFNNTPAPSRQPFPQQPLPPVQMATPPNKAGIPNPLQPPHIQPGVFPQQSQPPPHQAATMATLATNPAAAAAMANATPLQQQQASVYATAFAQAYATAMNEFYTQQAAGQFGATGVGAGTAVPSQMPSQVPAQSYAGAPASATDSQSAYAMAYAQAAQQASGGTYTQEQLQQIYAYAMQAQAAGGNPYGAVAPTAAAGGVGAAGANKQVPKRAGGR